MTGKHANIQGPDTSVNGIFVYHGHTLPTHAHSSSNNVFHAYPGLMHSSNSLLSDLFVLHFYLHYLTATGISCSTHNAFNRRTTNMISSYVSAWKKNVPNLTSTVSLSELLSESFGKTRLVVGMRKLNYDGGNSDGVLTSAQVNTQQTYLYYTKINCSFTTIWLPPPNPCPLGAHQHFLEIELGRKRRKQTGAKYGGHVTTEQTNKSVLFCPENFCRNWNQKNPESLCTPVKLQSK